MSTDANEAHFAVVLEDEMSGAADAAAGALRKLKGDIDRGEKSLAGMNRAMSRMKAAGIESGAVFDTLSKRIADQKERIGQAMSKYVDMGGRFSQASRASMSLQDRFASLSREISGMPGPLGMLGGSLARFGGMLGSGKVKVLALGAALVAFVAITAHAVKSLVSYTLEQANARRGEALRFEGLSKIRTMLGRTYGLQRAGASELQAAIDSVSASVSISRDKVAAYATQLQAAHVHGANLVPALQAVAQTASAQNDAQASMVLGMASYTSMMGGSVQKLANRVQRDVGGTVAKQMLLADVQAQKLGESYAALTTGIDDAPIRKATGAWNALFSQSTASGRALKHLLETLVQPLINGAAKAQTILTSLFEHALLSALKLETQYLLLRIALAKAFDKSVFDFFDSWLGVATLALGAWVAMLIGPSVLAALTFAASLLSTAGAAVIAAGGVQALAVSWLAAAGPMIAAGWAAAAPFLVMAGTIALAALALWGLIKIVELFYTVWKEVNWPSLWQGILISLDDTVGAFGRAGVEWAKALFDGIVQGIANFGATAIGELVDFAADMKTGFMRAIGAASPSKVFAALGRSIPQGLTVGIKAEQPTAQRAVDTMIAPEMPMPRAGKMADPSDVAGRTGRISSGGVTINNLSVTASGPEARTIAQDIKSELERVLEGVAIQMGAA